MKIIMLTQCDPKVVYRSNEKMFHVYCKYLQCIFHTTIFKFVNICINCDFQNYVLSIIFRTSVKCHLVIHNAITNNYQRHYSISIMQSIKQDGSKAL